MTKSNKGANGASNTGFLKLLLLGTAALTYTGVAHAQDAGDTQDEEARQDVVTITGTRQVIQNTIDIKRQATTIVDGLSASDIGDLPALSIGEALESITGAASHRENGGATEISIRGLGPFLSATTFNGREATNGSGDRSVNFSQFPSELMNKLAIYKTQDASLIEGGVAGLIALETLKPLEYGKRRFQVDLKGNYNPDQQNIEDSMAGDLGFRATASYVDQFKIEGLGDFGLSVGLQRSDISQPEQEMRSSSPSGTSLFACIADASDPDSRGYAGGSGDCEDVGPNSSNNDGYNTSIDPATGRAVDDGIAYAWASSSRGYRQNDTRDERDSAFVALQWQPNDRLDFNLDAQWSERVQSEDRYDLNFANMKRNTDGKTLESLQFQPNGVVQFIETQSDIESNGEIYSRAEDYIGYGLSGSYEATDRLTISGDYSFSETTREELQVSLRVSSQGGPGSGGRENVGWQRDENGFVHFGVVDFDVNDITNYTDGVRARIDSDVDRTNTVEAVRLDLNYDVDWGAVDSLDLGVRSSELSYVNLGGTRTTVTTSDLDPTAIPCSAGFAESDFLSSAGGALVTQFDASGNIVNSTNSWATFDNACLVDYILDAEGVSFAYPDQVYGNNSTTDVTEKTNAFYAMANFDTEFSDTPVRGNFGVRVVNTDVESLGFRNALNIVTDPTDGTIDLVEDSSVVERIVGGGDYTEVLPSLNIVMDVRDDVILRAGVFRGLSRADPADMNFSRSFSTDTGDDPTTLAELITGVNASGNPNFQPLTSWNYDIAMDWYPNDDTILAATIYAKDFKGGFENATTSETFTIDGQQVTVPVTLLSTNEDTSSLIGLELTASHRFQNLPDYLDGLGFKVSLNLADSDFEFEDSSYGDQGFRDANGNFVQTAIGIVEPGNIPGFSDTTFSGQLYYQKGDFDGSVIYKYRSDYFQPYTSNGTRLRYVGDVGVWEAQASYQLTNNVKLTGSAINLFDAPKEQYFYTDDNLGEVNYYGPRIFFGVRAKF